MVRTRVGSRFLIKELTYLYVSVRVLNLSKNYVLHVKIQSPKFWAVVIYFLAKDFLALVEN